MLLIVEEARRELAGTFPMALMVGSSCGFVGGPPQTWHSVHFLTAAGRADLLWTAMRGAPTNEARLWAAFGLAEARVIDRTAVNALARSLSGKVTTCSGCIIGESTPERAVFELYNP